MRSVNMKMQLQPTVNFDKIVSNTLIDLNYFTYCIIFDFDF